MFFLTLSPRVRINEADFTSLSYEMFTNSHFCFKFGLIVANYLNSLILSFCHKICHETVAVVSRGFHSLTEKKEKGAKFLSSWVILFYL